MTIQDLLNHPNDWVGYFGYGSLVNDRTRNADSFGFPGRLQGYRRRWSIWRASEERAAFGFGGVASLSVTPDPSALCDGLLVFDRKDHLPNVDRREAMYDRVPLDLSGFTTGYDLPSGINCYIYVGQPAHTDEVDPAYPILQSYLDAVMQGFLHKFGEPGLARFIAETDNWATPTVLDRESPFYPRYVSLSEDEQMLIDHYSWKTGSPLVPVPDTTPD